ncbi:MAG TPA: Uma2 family endonuclease [Chthoniobacteraceae bacterium]|jgi:Uma2 family endonuclease|nr:Uma2 family endonuclease [Chthoniobacteraceae bacterium]
MASERALRARFYEEVTEDLKAEFINGTVVKHSPVKDRHLAVRDSLHELLRTFCRVHRLGTVRGEKALCTFPRNDYEPDVVFFGPAKASLIEPTTMKFPIPDFICEVLSPSTELYDRGVKFRDFEAHGVGEYWLIDPERDTLEQYLLRDGSYELALKSGSGDVASTVVPGFRIPIPALFDDQENLRVLRSLLA